MFALAYYYLSHTNKELEEMPFAEKVREIEKTYKTEFLDLIRPEVVKVKGRENADAVLRDMCKL